MENLEKTLCPSQFKILSVLISTGKDVDIHTIEIKALAFKLSKNSGQVVS